MLNTIVGAFYSIILMSISLVVLPFAYAAAVMHRLRRTARRQNMPHDIANIRELLRHIAVSSRSAPHLRALLALEQMRSGDSEGANATIASAERAARHPLRRVMSLLDNSIDADFEIKGVADARCSYRMKDQPRPVNHAKIIMDGVKLWLRASDNVTDLVRQGDFEKAIAIALVERGTVSLEPASSLAFVGHQQFALRHPGCEETLRLAALTAARMSNWWPIGDDSGYRERALRLVAQVQALSGDIRGANDTLERILDPGTADSTAHDMAILHAARHELNEMAFQLWSIVAQDERVRASIHAAQVWHLDDATA